MKEILGYLNPFGPSIKVANIANIDIFIQRNLLFIYGLIGIFEGLDAIGFIAVYSLLLTFVLMHEYGHALTARYYGFNCKHISIGFLGGVASIEKLDEATPKQELFIVIMGPLVNFVWAAIFSIISLYLMDGTTDENLANVSARLFMGLAKFNFVIGLFNVLICVWPLDGGRIVKCIIKMLYSNPEKIEILSFRISLIVGLIGLYYFSYNFNLNAVFILILMILISWAEKCSQLKKIQATQ